MKKFKRRLSLTLRGSQTIDESLSELAEQMTVEESSGKDSGKAGREDLAASQTQRKQAEHGALVKPLLVWGFLFVCLVLRGKTHLNMLG